MKLIFCSHNNKKKEEIKPLLPASVELLSLDDLNCHEEIEETALTFHGNAEIKAKTIFEKFGIAAFGDDSGLEVEALNNEPGVFSARYAGSQKNDEDNMDLLLKNMESVENRKACFKTVICLVLDGKSHFFEGTIHGTIRREKSGTNGFGYDPIFEPENLGKTFAEMTLEEKNKLSHRARAVEKMIAFLNEIFA